MKVSIGTSTHLIRRIIVPYFFDIHTCISYGAKNSGLTYPLMQTCMHKPTYACYVRKVSNDISIHSEGKLCHIILKSIHKYRSYGLDKS